MSNNKSMLPRTFSVGSAEESKEAREGAAPSEAQGVAPVRERAEIARRIDEERVRRGWSRQQLAEAAQISPSSLSRMLGSSKKPSSEVIGRTRLLKLCKALDLDAAEVAGAGALQSPRVGVPSERLAAICFGGVAPTAEEARGVVLGVAAALHSVLPSRWMYGEASDTAKLSPPEQEQIDNVIRLKVNWLSGRK